MGFNKEEKRKILNFWNFEYFPEVDLNFSGGKLDCNRLLAKL